MHLAVVIGMTALGVGLVGACVYVGRRDLRVEKQPELPKARVVRSP